MKKTCTLFFALASLACHAQYTGSFKAKQKGHYAGPEGQQIRPTEKGDVCMRELSLTMTTPLTFLVIEPACGRNNIDTTDVPDADTFFFIGSNISEDVLMNDSPAGFDPGPGMIPESEGPLDDDDEILQKIEEGNPSIPDTATMLPGTWYETGTSARGIVYSREKPAPEEGTITRSVSFNADGSFEELTYAHEHVFKRLCSSGFTTKAGVITVEFRPDGQPADISRFKIVSLQNNRLVLKEIDPYSVKGGVKDESMPIRIIRN